MRRVGNGLPPVDTAQPGKEALERLLVADPAQPRWVEREDRPRTGHLVEADELDVGDPRGLEITGVLELPLDGGTPVGAEDDAPTAVIARDGVPGRRPRQLEGPALMRRTVAPRHRRRPEGQVEDHAFGQEPSSVRQQPEVRRRDRLDLPRPRVDGLIVHPAHEPGGMQLQVLPGRGPSDARPQEERRRLDAAARDDDDRGADRDPVRNTVGTPPDSLHANCAAVRDEDALRAALDHEARARVGRVLEVGEKGRLLLALLAATVAVPAEPRIVGRGVPREQVPAAPGLLESLDHQLVAPIRYGRLGVDPEPLPDAVLRRVEPRLVDALEALDGPPFTDVVRQPEADERVHESAAAECATGEDPHPPRPGPDDPAVQVRPRPVVQLLLQQIRLARVGPLLEDDDGQPGLLQT